VSKIKDIFATTQNVKNCKIGSIWGFLCLITGLEWFWQIKSISKDEKGIIQRVSENTHFGKQLKIRLKARFKFNS